jgi:hypothetical protein
MWRAHGDSYPSAYRSDQTGYARRRIDEPPGYSGGDLGRMAMFDLLLGNLDRFHEPSSRKIEYLNFENIDFRKHGNRYELVPLDNSQFMTDCPGISLISRKQN